MKMISKKIALYIMVGMLSVTATLNAYSLGVHATGFEWVGGAIAFEEAIKWLLASVGIVSAGGMTVDYWEQHGDEFVDYCTEQNITNTEVTEWQMKLCQGILDKGSACWSAFKSWASTLTGSSTGGGSVAGSPFLVKGGSYTWGSNNTLHNIKDFYSFYNTYTVNGQTFTGYFTTSQSYYENTNNIGHFIIASSIPLNENISNIGELSFTYDNKTVYYIMPYRNYIFPVTPVINDIANYYNTNSIFYDNKSTANTDFCAWLSVFGSGGVSDSDFTSVQQDVTTLDVIDSDLPDENASEVTIPMPGVADSDNTASADAYDDIVDLINDGAITIDEGLERIQGILKIITYDTVTDDVIPIQPDPDTGENKKKDDVVNENKDNMAFTLGGLETVFPFCIPWDIYAFLSILEAEPEAPKFNFPFRDPTTHQDVFYEVDLSVFEPVAVVTRYGADLIFIIGLALATRKLIGAGGGD